MGGLTVFYFTVNLDGYVFQNPFLVSSPLFGLVSLNSATGACSIKKNQVNTVITSHFFKDVTNLACVAKWTQCCARKEEHVSNICLGVRNFSEGSLHLATIFPSNCKVRRKTVFFKSFRYSRLRIVLKLYRKRQFKEELITKLKFKILF